jgi:hypothetical protein
MLCSVHTGYDELLLDENAFHSALSKYIYGKPTDVHQNSDSHEQSVQGLLQLIDFVFDMLRDAGLSVLHSVYISVRNKHGHDFERVQGWHKCAINRLPSLRCYRVDEHTTVHEQYIKLLRCLWLSTHIHDVEQQRQRVRAGEDMPREHAQLYRAALLFILQQQKQLYADLSTVCNLEKNMLHIKYLMTE